MYKYGHMQFLVSRQTKKGKQGEGHDSKVIYVGFLRKLVTKNVHKKLAFFDF